MTGATVRTAWETILLRRRLRGLLLALVTFTRVGNYDLVPVACCAAAPIIQELNGNKRDWRKGCERVKWEIHRVTLMKDEYWKAMTRFKYDDFKRLQLALRVPDRIHANGSVFSGEEALFVFLVRMHFPSKWNSLLRVLGGRARCAYTIVFYRMAAHIYAYKRCIDDVGRWTRFFGEFAAVMRAKGSAFAECIGFIDGTIHRIARPGGGRTRLQPDGTQRHVFSGHKKVHCLKYQAVMLPNGIIGDFFGPVAGKRSDAYLLVRSKFQDRMKAAQARAGRAYHVYGDPAYPRSRTIMRAHKGRNLSQVKRAQNAAMKSLRISVEWGFGGIGQQWGYTTHANQLKLFKQPVSKIFVCAAILQNLHTCCYGNQTAVYFDCAPPTMEAYLHGA